MTQTPTTTEYHEYAVEDPDWDDDEDYDDDYNPCQCILCHPDPDDGDGPDDWAEAVPFVAVGPDDETDDEETEG